MEDALLHLTLNNRENNPQVGIFLGNKLQGLLDIDEFLRSYSIDDIKNKNIQLAVTNVQKTQSEFATIKEQLISFEDLHKDNKFLDMPTHYQEDVDTARLCQAYYVYKQELVHKKMKVLLVDSNTYTTLDYISFDGHLGGHIVPGAAVLAQAYQSGSLSLNIDDLEGQVFSIPTSNKDSATNSAAMLIKAFLEKAIDKFGPTNIVITGSKGKLINSLLQGSGINYKLNLQEYLIHYSLSFMTSQIQQLKNQIH